MSVPTTMQALQMQAFQKLVCTEIPVPEPKPEEVLVRTLAATICTSDLHDLAHNPFGIALPRVLGHEAAGVVAQCGAEAQHLSPGTRVAAHPVIPCKTCVECKRGFAHLCQRMGHLGYDRDGTFAEYFVVPAERVRVLPEAVPTVLGALLEPVSVCLQAVARAGDVLGKNVLVIGDGPFGNIIARLALRAGANLVLVVGREPFRLQQIRGAETSREAPNKTMDVAILAVSSSEAAATSLAALRPRGRLVIFSALPDPVPIDLFSLHISELEIVGACNDEDRLNEALECLSDPNLALEELITHTLPFPRWPEAFELARNGHDQALKVALTFETSNEND